MHNNLYNLRQQQDNLYYLTGFTGTSVFSKKKGFLEVDDYFDLFHSEEVKNNLLKTKCGEKFIQLNNEYLFDINWRCFRGFNEYAYPHDGIIPKRIEPFDEWLTILKNNFDKDDINYLIEGFFDNNKLLDLKTNRYKEDIYETLARKTCFDLSNRKGFFHDLSMPVYLEYSSILAKAFFEVSAGFLAIKELNERFYELFKELSKKNPYFEYYIGSENDYLKINNSYYFIDNDGRFSKANEQFQETEDIVKIPLKTKVTDVREYLNKVVYVETKDFKGLKEMSEVVDEPWLFNHIVDVEKAKRLKPLTKKLLTALKKKDFQFFQFSKYTVEDFDSFSGVIFETDKDLLRLNFLDTPIALKNSDYLFVKKVGSIYEDDSFVLVDLNTGKETRNMLNYCFDDLIQANVGECFTFDEILPFIKE